MTLPILYTFRRCPYCIRARMTLAQARIVCEMREIDLKNKPHQMLDISPKGTVPILSFGDGTVIDESIDIMYWAMNINDPDGWLDHPKDQVDKMIQECDSVFSKAVTRYKYPEKFGDPTPDPGRAESMIFLEMIERRLIKTDSIMGDRLSLADIALLPLVRQFSKIDSEWFYTQPSLKHTAQWLDRLTQSELFESIMEKYSLWQGE